MVRSFARGLRLDHDAVAAGIGLPWNSGPVEGPVTKIELAKRQSYGKAGFPLLRKRLRSYPWICKQARLLTTVRRSVGQGMPSTVTRTWTASQRAGPDEMCTLIKWYSLRSRALRSSTSRWGAQLIS